AYALKLWKEIIPKLVDMRVLTEADLLALEILCNSYHEYRQADEVIQEEGLTYETATVSGATKITKRPEVEIRADAHRRLLRMIQEFGITPSARTGVKVPDGEVEDPFASYMGAKSGA
ncbi:MAG: phage terminase small subunit P27 family, partial [Thermoanaerobaculia bacterium]